MSDESRPSFRGTDRFGILRRLGAGGMGVVYEAYDRERESLVALKTLRRVNPETIYRFKQEFRTLAEVVHPRLVPLYELFSDGEQWFFTMELLADGVDLKRSLRSAEPVDDATVSAGVSRGTDDATEDETIDMPAPSADGVAAEASGTGVAQDVAAGEVDRVRVVDVFGQLAEGVIALHDRGILHRDLKPANVMVRNDGSVVLLDFGLVQQLAHGDGEMFRQSPGAVPESSESGASDGRRITGSVAYMAPEQAEGQPLSEASDWYAVGVMLHEVLTGRLPFAGSAAEILRSKLTRDPEDPRTLVPELPEDLGRLCLELLDREPERRPSGHEVLARFGGGATGTDGGDRRPVGPAPTPFVGRRRHLELLSSCHARAAGGELGICRVHGRSGAGKTALIEHFLDRLAARDGAVVLSGRCYEQESVPFKAIDSVLDDLTRYLLSLPPRELDGLLPANSAALARVFPATRRIDQVATTADDDQRALSLEELRAEAFAALREMLCAIGDRRPVVLYIDDLQWGDLDSAVLLRELVVAERLPRLLLLFSYRTEYLETSSCLRALQHLADAGRGRVFEETLEVDALTPQEALELATGLIGGDMPEAAAQAEWVALESGGGAFFVYELAHHLRAGFERFDVGEIHLDDVLWRRVQRLPEDTRRLLEVIAVAGRPVQLRHAQDVARLRTLPPEMVAALRSERLIRTTGPGLGDEAECYHDRIRESVVARLDPARIRNLHALFAAALERSGDAKSDLLAVHLEGAGELERAGSFYLAAADEAVQAVAFDRAESLFRKALEYAGDRAAKAAILERMVHFFTDLARFDDAYEVGREGTALFGIRLPEKFQPLSFVVDLVVARLRLGKRRVAEILEMPPMTDDQLAGAVRLIAALAKAAYQLRPELCVAVNAKMVNLCLKHGNTADSAIGYMVFGSIFLGGILGQYRRGYEFGRLSLDLVERYRSTHQEAEVNFVVGYFGSSWLRPAREAEALWQRAYSTGVETGDLFHTGCACCATVLSHFMRGVPLPEIDREASEFLELLQKFGLREPEGAVMAVRQATRNLRGETAGRLVLDDVGFDEKSFVAGLADFGSRHFAHYFYIVKMQLAYLWGEQEAAIAIADEADSFLKDSRGMLHAAEHRFYQALAVAGAAKDRRRRSELRTVRKAHRAFARWASHCPHNFRHKERVIAGELARLNGELDNALRCFEGACEAAAEHGYLHIEALGHQLAAAAVRDADPASADSHLAAARELYGRWGADAYSEWLARAMLSLEKESQN